MRLVESIVVAAAIAALATFAVARTHVDVRPDCAHEASANRDTTGKSAAASCGASGSTAH